MKGRRQLLPRGGRENLPPVCAGRGISGCRSGGEGEERGISTSGRGGEAVGKSKDRTETVGPKKWVGPVSVQLQSGPRQAFGLGPKGEIRPSLLPSTSAGKNPTILSGYCRRTLNPRSKSL